MSLRIVRRTTQKCDRRTTMTTRRNVFIGASALVASASAVRAAAQTASPPDAQKLADFLFVQTAKGFSFDKATNTLTLTGISPVTLFFSDRPERIAGNMKTASFVPFWSTGKDSFLSDPPNADISSLEGSQLHQAVVVLRDPVLDGDNLRYMTTPVQGDMPASGADVSVFIDIIGMPFTPLSFAGAARRSYRRAFIYR
jgi:hypothetical protein